MRAGFVAFRHLPFNMRAWRGVVLRGIRENRVAPRAVFAPIICGTNGHNSLHPEASPSRSFGTYARLLRQSPNVSARDCAGFAARGMSTKAEIPWATVDPETLSSTLQAGRLKFARPISAQVASIQEDERNQDYQRQ